MSDDSVVATRRENMCREGEQVQSRETLSVRVTFLLINSAVLSEEDKLFLSLISIIA